MDTGTALACVQGPGEKEPEKGGKSGKTGEVGLGGKIAILWRAPREAKDKEKPGLRAQVLLRDPAAIGTAPNSQELT